MDGKEARRWRRYSGPPFVGVSRGILSFRRASEFSSCASSACRFGSIGFFLSRFRCYIVLNYYLSGFRRRTIFTVIGSLYLRNFNGLGRFGLVFFKAIGGLGVRGLFRTSGCIYRVGGLGGLSRAIRLFFSLLGDFVVASDYSHRSECYKILDNSCDGAIRVMTFSKRGSKSFKRGACLILGVREGPSFFRSFVRGGFPPSRRSVVVSSEIPPNLVVKWAVSSKSVVGSVAMNTFIFFFTSSGTTTVSSFFIAQVPFTL